MNTDKIELLLKAIEYGSLSKAAEEFSYTPSAMSHILSGFESELGAKVINRTYKGIEIEPGYEDVIEKLKKIIEIKNETISLIKAKNTPTNDLTIVTYSSLSKFVIPKIIKEFNYYNKDINFNIIIDEYPVNVFKEKKADLIIGENKDNKELCWNELIVDPYVAVMPKNFKLRGNSVKREELYDKSYIMACDTKSTNYIDYKRIKNLIKVESQDDSSVIHIVKEGLGVAVLPYLSVKNEDNIVCAALEPPLMRKLGILYKKSDYINNPILNKFVKFIKKLDFSTI